MLSEPFAGAAALQAAAAPSCKCELAGSRASSCIHTHTCVTPPDQTHARRQLPARTKTMMAAAAAAPTWLPDLAASRAATTASSCSNAAGGGRRRHTLHLLCEPSSLAVASSLLAAFAAQPRGQQPSQGLPRGVEVTVEQPAPSSSSSVSRGDGQAATDGGDAAGVAGSSGGGGGSSGPAPLVVHFTATDPAAEGAVEEAARLFEVRAPGVAVVRACLQAGRPGMHARRASAARQLPAAPPPPGSGAHQARPPPRPQAYWQYHVKAAKSDLHCRMRARLAGLRQQLLLHTFGAAD